MNIGREWFTSALNSGSENSQANTDGLYRWLWSSTPQSSHGSYDDIFFVVTDSLVTLGLHLLKVFIRHYGYTVRGK